MIQLCSVLVDADRRAGGGFFCVHGCPARITCTHAQSLYLFYLLGFIHLFLMAYERLIVALLLAETIVEKRTSVRTE